MNKCATLIVIACSARKRDSQVTLVGGPGVVTLLPNKLASELTAARARVAAKTPISESLLLPAFRRYCGRFYERAALTEPEDIVILSGGYGLVLGAEPIGNYDRTFRPADWPGRVVQRSLAAVAVARGATKVVAFLGRSTMYASAFRATQWPQEIESVQLVSPVWRGGGAQVHVPRIAADAYRAFVSDGELPKAWTDAHGNAVAIEELR